MGIMCVNVNCKHYFEDSCTLALNGKIIHLDAYGRCEEFERGENDMYKNLNELLNGNKEAEKCLTE